MAALLTKEILDKATADAGLPAMVWMSSDGHVGQQRLGWWWTTPLSDDVVFVQRIGRQLCASVPDLDFTAAVSPLGRGVALAVGFAGLSSHYCLTNALNAGDASVVIPFDFLRLPLIAVLAWMIYGEPLDPMVFAGGALIFAGVIWSLRGETRRAKKLQ